MTPRPDVHHSRRPLATALLVACALGCALAGCEAGDGRKPIDEPLTAEDALRAGDEMDRDAAALLNEKGGDDSQSTAGSLMGDPERR